MKTVKVKELKEKMSSQELQEQIQKDRHEREVAFQKELNEIAKKYNCDLQPTCEITGQGIKMGLKIVAL